MNKAQSILKIFSESNSDELTFKQGQGYWDVSKFPYGGDFKRIKGDETGTLIKDGFVSKADEIKVKLNDGRDVVIQMSAVTNMPYDGVVSLRKKMGQISNDEQQKTKLRDSVSYSLPAFKNLSIEEIYFLAVSYGVVPKFRPQYLKSLKNIDDIKQNLIKKLFLNSAGSILPETKNIFKSFTNDERIELNKQFNDNGLRYNM